MTTLIEQARAVERGADGQDSEVDVKALSWLAGLTLFALFILLTPFAILLLCVELTFNKITGRRMP